MAFISMQGISLAFISVPLFDGVNLTIERGEKVGLVGRKGSGKSTLLRLIEGSVTGRLEGGPVLISSRDRRYAGERYPLGPAAGLATKATGLPAFLARCAGAREKQDAYRWVGAVVAGAASEFVGETGLSERSRRSRSRPKLVARWKFSAFFPRHEPPRHRRAWPR